MKEKESDIQKAICEYLTLKKVFFWRQNTMPVFSEGRFRAMPEYALKGVSDIIAVMPPNGQIWAIEIKSSKGVLSESQHAFKGKIEALGGIYTIATSVDDIVTRTRSGTTERASCRSS